ncbi:unnamed protein product [Cunninghamella echinulata]
MADTLTITPPPEQIHNKDNRVNNNTIITDMIDTTTITTDIDTTNTPDTAELSIPTPTTPTTNTATNTTNTALKNCESCDHWEKQYNIQQKEISNLKKDITDRDDELIRLQKDMQLLNTKYVSAIDRVADIQHEKDLVEHDVEELSCKLFEEANDMVAIEKKEKWLLEKELKTVKQQLMDEKAQLHELRQRLLQWDNEERHQHQHHQKQNKLKKKKSTSLITTTLKEEDESNMVEDHEAADGDIELEEGDNDDINGSRLSNDQDIMDQVDDDDEEAEEEDDQFEDAVENLEDPQVRAKRDLALLHGIKKKKNKNRSSNINVDNDNKGLIKKKQQLRSVSMPPPPSTTNKKQYTITPTVDQIQLEAFQQFVHSSSNVPLKKLYQFAYIKYCQLEDVEPCLRFGPHSRLSVKKMMDYLLHQPCYIEHMPNHANNNDGHQNDSPTSHNPQQPVTTMIPSSVAQRSLIWDRWHSSLTSSHSNNNMQSSSSTTTKSISSSSSTVITAIGCAACGRPKEKNNSTLYYQFRLDEKDDWLPIDQYCRDRLVAVCEFFVFIRNIHLRLYSHRSIDDLYSENIRLRLQMFYSRMGALPVVLEGMGLNADSIGRASNPHDQGYESSGSISSHCPTTPK